MYAVTGSTGQVGSATVKALLRAGRKVRALVRNPDKKEAMAMLGAEPFVASVEDPGALEAAFQDIEAVFVMTPPLLFAPDPRSEHRCALAALHHALKAAHVRRVVCLSSIGAEQEKGTGAILKGHDMERLFFDMPIDVAAIRAAYFMENFAPVYPHVKSTGTLPTLQDDIETSLPMVATFDIGSLAGELLTGNWSGHRIFELEGPERYSIARTASVFGSLLHREVKVEIVPAEARVSMLTSRGLSEGAAKDMVEMAAAFDNGRIAFAGGEGVTHLQGATDLEAVYRER